MQETEALDFAGSVEWLADRYAVTLEYEESSPDADRRRAERERLLKLLDTTASFYQRYLWDAVEAEAARSYLEQRGITRESADRFRLGYASAAADRVQKAALARQLHGRPSCHRPGLAARGGDRFRERLMFPLTDARGRVRGFGARQMPGGRPPKYLNTSDGSMFRKSDILYGLDHARRGDRPRGCGDRGRGLHRRDHAAPARHRPGGGLDGHRADRGPGDRASPALLRRVLLAFDADAAGREASLRGMDLARAKGLNVRIVRLPGGRDPADVAGDGSGRVPAGAGRRRSHT